MNTPTVITIGRQLGSGGKAIAQLMGQALNIPVYDRRLILMAAEESGLSPEVIRHADEVASHGSMSHILRALSSPFSSYGSIYTNSLSNEALFRLQSDIIIEKAENESCIIVGRCSDYVLRDHPRHISIFISADMEDRISRIAERQKCTHQEAQRIITETDAHRADYHDFYCETNWGDSRSYKICINSSVLGIPQTAEFLLEYVRLFQKKS